MDFVPCCSVVLNVFDEWGTAGDFCNYQVLLEPLVNKIKAPSSQSRFSHVLLANGVSLNSKGY